MDWLNYHHLLYFWTVAREGTIARACEKLLLAQPTISAQLKSLEKSLGHKLFRRSGRNLELTEMGQMVYRYADQIFTLGRELKETVHGQHGGLPLRLLVGVADVLPKLVAFELIRPALLLSDEMQIVCRENSPDHLLGELATHELDVVLSDAPAPPTVKVRAYNHLLGESPVSVFGTPQLVAKYRQGFPGSLTGAPLLLPSGNTVVRRAFELWLVKTGIRPRIVGEFDDTALMKVFGQAGTGLFIGPAVIEDEIKRQFEVQVLGRLPEVREQFYAISVERRLKHPAVVAICEAARKWLAP
jgi:LysR family transcriptional activator of nhaA